MSGLSHVDETGDVRMVDVGGKPLSRRRAVAHAQRAYGSRHRETAPRAAEGRRARDGAAGGDHGRQAHGRARSLSVTRSAHARGGPPRGRRASVEIEASAETTAQTGVEMEALVAATMAALTVYDMAKAVDKGMVIGDVHARGEDEGAGE